MSAAAPTPTVSICLPTLNAQPFLAARLASIQAQSHADWTLTAIDGHSDDGTWEELQRQAASDSRIQADQAPREGIYAAINACIRRSQGEAVYIATADDTMSADCLARMVAALDEHPECDLCHCCLQVIDETGAPLGGASDWQRYPPGRYFGEWLDRPHVRMAPHDGLLHFGLRTVYHSLTQLLIRRRLLNRIGLFDARFGPVGDFEWCMRASLVSSTVHIPEYLATWRVHTAQATDAGEATSASVFRHLALMSEVAWDRAGRVAPARLRPEYRRRLAPYYRHQFLMRRLWERRRVAGKLDVFARCLTRWPGSTLRYAGARALGHEPGLEDEVAWIREELTRMGVPGPVAAE